MASSRAVWLQAVLVLAIGWFYFWTAVPQWRPGLIASRDDGYYNLLIRGFLRGHLYLDAKADPYLATLANPWDPAERGDHGMPDTSYFRGRYYIYFGVSPALLVFLPFRILTGRFLSEALAPPLFAGVGFLISVWLVSAVRRRYFPRASDALFAACVLALGLANMVPVLLRRPSFREIPIACGYACCMAGLAAIYRALHSRRPALWLAAAGVALGLAVGSRPLYLLACPAVLLPVWLEARERRLGAGCWRDRAWRKLALAAVVPLAMVGLGLALYNYLRFGNPVEFGLRYQLWNDDPAKTTRFAWRFFVFNLHAYWLAPAGWSRYFPFVNLVRLLPPTPRGFYGVEDPFGIIPNMPFALLALGVLALAARSSAGISRRCRVFCAAVALTAVTMSLTLLAFQAALNRYMVDFTPAVMLLACLGALVLSAQPWYRGAVAALGTFAACGLSGYSAAFNVLASLRHDDLLQANYPEIYQRLAQRCDWLPYLYDRWRQTAYGPIEMKVVFPTGLIGHVQPLVVTGRAFLSDYLFVNYTGPDSLRFGLEHTSRGTFLGQPVKIQPGGMHTLRIDLGSLYPPAADPYFAAMSPAQARLRQNTVRVVLDGKVAFRRILATYEAAGPVPSVGSSGDQQGFPEPFSGRILSWRRLPEAALTSPDGRYGAIRLEFRLPSFPYPHSEPLVSTGEIGRGDLIYVRYESPGRIAFGYDHAGSGEFVGPRLPVDPSATQVVEIDSGALHPPPSGGSAESSRRPRRGRLVIRLNGSTAFAMPAPYYPADPDTFAVGFNAIQASSASAAFTGDLISDRRIGALAPERAAGPLRLELKFPEFSGAHNEPLVCSGEAGRGDLIYVHYETPDRVSFGYDHWSVGGSASPLLAVDPRAVQAIEIDYGALHPASSAVLAIRSVRSPRGRLWIRLNGRTVLDEVAPYYPCDPTSVAVGLNSLGASTAAAGFTGELVKAEWTSNH